MAEDQSDRKQKRFARAGPADDECRDRGKGLGDELGTFIIVTFIIVPFIIVAFVIVTSAIVTFMIVAFIIVTFSIATYTIVTFIIVLTFGKWFNL